MKKILSLIKSNLLSFICVVVAIVALPALIFLSSGKTSKIHNEIQSDLDGKNRTLQQVTYRYTFEPVTPASPKVEISRPPTQAMNEAMKSWGEQLRAQAAESIEVVVARNSQGKRVLVEGLLPEPAEPVRVAKLQEIREIWPSAHRALVSRVGAGTPPDRATLEAKLNITWRQKLERIQSTLGAEASIDDQEKIRAELRDQRLAEYKAAASELHFYVDPGAFADVEPWSQNTLPPMDRVWDWQWTHWIHADLLKALELANTEGEWVRSLLEGPVKRLERVSVPALQYSGESQPAPIDYASPIEPNWEVSETGRAAWPSIPQGLYDVRYATITVLIDGARLLDVVEAISATNLMRVVRVSLTDVDPTQDIQQGYVYGAGRIVRADLTIETVWLRSWMQQYMPSSVRTALGIPAEAPEGQEQEEQPRGRRR
ncbi:MAG: hypothetical protein H6813_07095 [Phycisphaeraceae bacterium]|nr:hypothetical protein [Phycisphaeraceae bacterium]MCB9848702.1 hypothetical protein [Phycisphaeraceae bacterium]